MGTYGQRYAVGFDRFVLRLRLILQGSRIGCIGRFVCCTLMIAVFIFVSIILALALVSSIANACTTSNYTLLVDSTSSHHNRNRRLNFGRD